MAGYLAAQFPGDYYSGDEAKSLDFIGYFDNQRQKEAAHQNQEINRQMALDDLFAQQQERPLNLRRKELDNQGLEALLPQKQAQGKQAERDWEVEQGIPVEQRRTALMGKIAREIQEDELKRYESEVKRMMSDPMVLRNPNAKAMAEGLYGLLPEIRKMREGFQSKEDIAATAAAAREAAAKETTARQLAVIQARAEQARQQAAVKGPKGYEEAATKYTILAEAETDPEKKALYEALRDKFELAKLEAAKAAKAGGIDVGAVAELPTTQVAPQLGGGTAAPQKKIKPPKAGEILIYKDGKPVGYIPESQREQAIKDGYTLK